MMKQWKRLRTYMAQKKISKVDIALVVFIIAAFFGIYRGREQYEVLPNLEVELVNPYLAQADEAGNFYVIDEERARVVKVNAEGKVDYLLQSNSLEADTFWYAEDITVGEDGIVYLLDASWDETGSAVGRECVLSYDKDGRYLDTILDITYEDEWVDKHKLFALTYWQDTLYYVVSEEEGFSLNAISTEGGQTERVQFFVYENAFNLIQDYALDAETKTVYALDKRGRIIKGSGETLEVLYDTAKDSVYAGEAAFYRIAAVGENRVYITDIKGNRIFSYTEGQQSLEIFREQGQVLSITSCMKETGDTILGIWQDWGILVQSLDDEIGMPEYSFAKSTGYLVKESLYQMLVFMAVIGVIWCVFRIVFMLRYIKLNEIQKKGVMAASASTIVALIIVSQLLGQFESVYREELLSKLYVLAYTTSGMVDGDSVNRIHTSEDYMGDEYQDLMETLNIALNKKDPSVQDVYCNVLRYEDGKGFAIAYLDNSIGTFYPVDEAETEELHYIYQTGEGLRNAGKNDVTGSYIYVRLPVMGEDGTVSCVIEVGTTSEVIAARVAQMRTSILITLILIITIVLLLFSEILSFFDLKEKYKIQKQEKKEGVPLHLLRLGVFITYVAFNVSGSFLPVYAASFVTEKIGIPEELAASLPITLNMAFIGLTSLFCAGILKKFSFRAVAAISACISMTGDLMLLMGQGYVWVVVGLILNGIGMGFITNSTYMFLAGCNNEEVQKEGYSLFNAGSLAGINCGMMLGASLAENIGQRLVFCCSAGAWLAVAVLFFVMGKYMPLVQDTEQKKHKKAEIGALKMPLAYMLFIQFPYVIINSFVFYYVPIYGDEHGLGESIVCLLLMLNSLCSVYLSVVMTDYMSKKFGEKSIYISSILSFAALLLFGWNDSITMLIIVLILLGAVSSFGSTVRQLYFTQLPSVKKYGEEEAVGIYNFMDSIGESAGPMLFGSIFSGASAFIGLSGFVAVSGAMNGIYALFFKKHKKS